MKTNDSSERLKILMRKQTALAAASVPAPPPSAFIPQVVAAEPARPSPMPAATPIQMNAAVKWDRVTIRLTVGELEKINDVVIATQQANRTGKITTTDVLRTALRRLKDQEAIRSAEIAALRAQDARISNRRNIKPS